MTTPNLPAIAGTPNAPANSIQALVAPTDISLWTSLDTTTNAGKSAVIRHMNGDEAERLTEAVNTVVEVQDILAHRVEIVDTKTGEVIDADRIVLIRPDGSGLACVSTGVRRSLQTIFALFGLPPYRPAMKMRVVNKRTKAGRMTTLLTPEVEDAEAVETSTPAAAPTRARR